VSIQFGDGNQTAAMLFENAVLQDCVSCDESIGAIEFYRPLSWDAYHGRLHCHHQSIWKSPANGEKMVFSRISREWKARDVRASIDMLSWAGVIHRILHTSGAGLPLSAQADDTVFKTLFLDVGLMNTLCGAQPLTLEQFQSHRFLHEEPLAEQFVGQQLLYSLGPQNKPELFYWQREGKSSNAEVDYIIPAGPFAIPVEVKAGVSGTLRSLHQFAASYHPALSLRFDCNPPSTQYVRHTIISPEGKKQVAYKLLSLPLYHAEDAARLAKHLFLQEPAKHG
jgi:hypothetical protein